MMMTAKRSATMVMSIMMSVNEQLSLITLWMARLMRMKLMNMISDECRDEDAHHGQPVMMMMMMPMMIMIMPMMMLKIIMMKPMMMPMMMPAMIMIAIALMKTF